jgi:hypothetical protein
MLRPAIAMTCIVAFLACFPAIPAGAQRAVPAGPPDLYITPSDIRFTDGNGTPVDESTPGTILFINVTVHNAGPAGSGPFDVSFFENGALLETVPVRESVAARNSTPVSLLWDTSLSFVGLCGISVGLDCHAGDANLSNNTASRTIRLNPVAPTVNITLDLPEAVFEPGGGGNQLLKLTGKVAIAMPFNQTAVVQLVSGMNNGWACAVQPAALAFEYTWSKAFSVSVVVPPDAEGGYSANLTIGANASSDGYSVPAQAICRITVKPVNGLSVECDRGYLEIRPGQTARFTLAVTNTGNAMTDYDLSIDNLEHLNGTGWAIILSPSNLTRVRPGERRTVNITARSSDEFSIWHSVPSVIILKASTLAQGNSTPEAFVKFPVYAYEKGASTWGQVALVPMASVFILLMLWMFYFFWKAFWKGFAEAARKPKGP